MTVNAIEDLSGVLPALVSPLHRDGSADESGIKRLVEHVISGGVHGLLALGSTGEGAALGERIRLQVLKSVVEAGPGRGPGGCGGGQPHPQAPPGRVAAASRPGGESTPTPPPSSCPSDHAAGTACP